ncbi:hypothetical protein C8A00DRAFT_18056 [Chaetomidium leptoderma]|uniref:Chromo domain-containing protein n=1 Tax=Chaetomidium leptoderma TaxID=669021 RepID=A0AAN6VGJ8_9PEZI|nr:hypothetical protein C8A00DRAFT_18056 [Chaetomidium leptoderma]
MARVCLDKQVFYKPPVATGPSSANRGLLVRKRGLSSADIFAAPFFPPPLPLQQDAHDPRHGGAGNSEDTAILIPGDSESDGRSDMPLASLVELVTAASKELKSSGVAGAGESLDTVPDDVSEPSVTSRPGRDDESAVEQQQRGRLGCSPEPLSGSPETLHTTRTQPIPPGCAAFQTGQPSALDNTLRDTTVPETTDATSLAEHGATRHSHGMQHGPQPPEKPYGTTSNHDGSICLDNEEWDRRFPFSSQALQRRRAAKRAYNPTERDQSQSMLDPHCQSQGPRLAASGLDHGVDPQQRSGSCRLSQHRDHRDDGVQTSDPEYRHPLVLDDRGEQDKESSVVPPQAQESRVGMPSLSGDESGNERDFANIESSMQPSAQHNIGRRRRRLRCDADDEDCRPIVESGAKQGKDEDLVRPPRRKRRRVNTSAPTTRRTAPKRQTRLRCTNSPSPQAQQPPPTQGPKRRQSQRRISKPQPARGSALEEETLGAAFASFEEWPLEAVLKRVWVDGAATFQVEFTWNPCTNHGQNDGAPERSRRKSPVGRISSTARALPSRVASTTEETRVDEYFKVEDIRDWRQGEEGREYLVKWAGYGNKHNTWEPAAHFEECPEVLEEFHQKAGLSTAPSM